uniref:Polycomb protein PHO-like isoform X2 n=1 Tax=Dermatophagoides pteronyssinus TaxID=6956 RepID=A0A6P6XWD8_DERPT|nr:polycomb protein PHO-like isoform X2 [Dermatophagoides pteronyssinus]
MNVRCINAMFILDENQEHNLLVILNEINRHMHCNHALEMQQDQTTISVNNNKRNLPNTATTTNNNQRVKSSFESIPLPITGFNLANRQCLIDFILNTVRYFNTFFHFTSSSHYDDCFGHTKSKCIIFWLSFFYNRNLYENIDFEQIFDTISDEESNTYHNHSHQQQQQQHSNHNDKILSNKELGAKNKNIINGLVMNTVATTTTATNNNTSNNNLKDANQSIPMDELVSRMNVLQELHLPTGSVANQQQQQPQQTLYPQTLSNLNEFNVAAISNNVGLSTQLTSTFHQQLNNLPQLSNIDQKLSSNKDNNNTVVEQLFTVEQQNQLNYQTIRDITFISLLITVIFYKLRHLFPTLVNLSRSDVSWKFLINFERDIDVSFMHETFLEFLQNELLQQRLSNKKRTENLKQEVIFMEKICKMVDKEIETEVGRIVSSSSSHSTQQNKTNKIPTLMLQPPVCTTTSIGQNGQSISTLSNTEKSNVVKGLRPCPHCGKVFRNTYKLNRHLYVHKDPSEKPFMCNWDNCNYRSISKNDLNRHRMIHTGEKPYVCEVGGCEKRYSRADKLRHHKLSVHFKDLTKKEQICIWPGCNFQCLSKSELNRHQSTHQTIKCNYIGCDKIFDKVDKLKKHREKDHIKIEATISTTNEFASSGVHFAVPTISVTSTPDIATVAASSNHHHPQQQQQQQHPGHGHGHQNHHTNSHQHHSSNQQQQQLQLQQIQMLTQNQLNSIAALHPTALINSNDDNRNTVAKLSDLSSHMTLGQVAPDSTPNGTTQQQQQQTNTSHVNNNNVINTISSTTSSIVPITSIVSVNHESNSSNDPGQQQQHRQNSISVWSS